MAFFPSTDTAKEITLTANIQLDYPYSANLANVTVADMMDVTATIGNLNIFLPDATQTTPGFSISFNNVGANSFNIVLNDQLTLFTPVAAGKVLTVYLYDTTTPNGSWRIIPFGGGVNGISELTLTSTDNSITVTGSPVSPPSGTLDIKLPSLISAITELANGTPGILALDPETNSWSLISLVNGSNIVITNPSGVGGNPTISLGTVIVVNQITAGNIIINNDLITNTDSGGVLSIVSNGTNSALNLNSVLVDTEGNITGINNLTIEGIFKSVNTAKAWCRFSNTSGTIAVSSSCNVSGVTYNSSNSQYVITFTSPMGNLNYGVFISCANNNSTPPLAPRIGYDIVRQLNSVTIVLTDSSGEMLPDIPEGVSVMIFSTS
jgi:hypothetical protein